MPTDADLDHVRNLLRHVGGKDVAWGAQSMLDALVVAHRLRAERQAARRVLTATWVLAIATIGLVLATVVLTIATLQAPAS